MLVGAFFPKLVKYKKPWPSTAAPAKISDPDRSLMTELDISHNGDYFVVETMHFDRLQEAVEYARQLRRNAV